MMATLSRWLLQRLTLVHSGDSIQQLPIEVISQTPKSESRRRRPNQTVLVLKQSREKNSEEKFLKYTAKRSGNTRTQFHD